MGRGATAAVLTELSKGQNRPVHLVRVYFDEGTVAMTDCGHDLVRGGVTYSALGGLLKIAKIKEEAEVVISKMRITLDGVGPTWISYLLGRNYIDRKIDVYLALIDNAGNIIDDPVVIFDGRIDSPQISEDPRKGTATVSLSAANAWIDFTRITGRHTNHQDQQVFFPGDLGFEFTSEVEKDITWGRESNSDR
jgi:hypothetical protein